MAEMVACPSCQRKLQVPEHYLGQQVQCPECRHLFVATATTMSAQPIPAPAKESAPGSKPRRYEDDEDDFPSHRRRDEFDDDLDYDDIRNRRGRRGRYPPHRAGVVLTLGIVALAGGMALWGLPFVIGPVAWLMGMWDLREMRAGRMDPDGIGMTQAGMVCGIVATCLLLLGILGIGFCVFVGLHG